MLFKHILLILTTIAFYIVSTAVPASAFWCKGGVIREGMTNVEVYQKCGPPQFQQVIGKEKLGDMTYLIEQWYYNQGSHRLTRYLTFRGGVLEKIERGDWGR